MTPYHPKKRVGVNSHVKVKGFTLLEVVIYIAIFSILMSGVLITVYQLLEAGRSNLSAVAVQEEGTFVNRKISWALAGATDVDVPDPKTLIITRPDLGLSSPIVIKEEDGMMKISRGGAAAVPLTTSELEVHDTNITMSTGGPSLPTSVRIEYEIAKFPFLFITYLHF